MGHGLIQGRIQEFVQGGSLNFFFSFQGGDENPLKSIDFTGPGGGLSPHSPPLNTPLASLVKSNFAMKYSMEKKIQR